MTKETLQELIDVLQLIRSETRPLTLCYNYGWSAMPKPDKIEWGLGVMIDGGIDCDKPLRQVSSPVVKALDALDLLDEDSYGGMRNACFRDVKNG
jgi:hypothetical protein